jgi:DNA-binding NtrC family response regulator
MKADLMLLLVMTRGRRSHLLERLEKSVTEVLAVCDCKEARLILQTGLPIEVVITDAKLPDGTWRTVVESAAEAKKHVEVVVCARMEDVALWRDALDHGAYDLLFEPYESQEVSRIVQSAAAKSRMRSLRNALVEAA